MLEKIGIFKKYPILKDISEIAIAFIIAFVFYQVLIIAMGTSMPIVAVVSGSMEPVLHRGDLILVIGEPNPQIGNIIVYNRNDFSYTIIHRVIKITDEGYVTKGDNNPIADPWGVVTKSQVVGKAIFAVPLLGYPKLFLFDSWNIVTNKNY